MARNARAGRRQSGLNLRCRVQNGYRSQKACDTRLPSTRRRRERDFLDKLVGLPAVFRAPLTPDKLQNRPWRGSEGSQHAATEGIFHIAGCHARRTGGEVQDEIRKKSRFA